MAKVLLADLVSSEAFSLLCSRLLSLCLHWIFPLYVSNVSVLTFLLCKDTTRVGWGTCAAAFRILSHAEKLGLYHVQFWRVTLQSVQLKWS